MEQIGYAREFVTGRDISKKGLWRVLGAVMSAMVI